MALAPVINSPPTMPAQANIAKRPLLISLFCNSEYSFGSVGLRPSGSKPRSPGGLDPLGEEKNSAKPQAITSEVTLHGRNVRLCTSVEWMKLVCTYYSQDC